MLTLDIADIGQEDTHFCTSLTKHFDIVPITEATLDLKSTGARDK